VDNKQIGVISLNEALGLARTHGVDLVEISPNAVPPVCRLVDFGKYRYELPRRTRIPRSARTPRWSRRCS
jgi:translation initiation factor IF-3